MKNEKIEELLYLAMEVPNSVRQKSIGLSVGFEESREQWELIVKYHGDLEELRNLGIEVEILFSGYAILTVPSHLVEEVAAYENIEYVEKPRRFIPGAFLPQEAVEASRITKGTFGLTGKGVLVGILDSGIHYERADFRKEDGASRILYYWDQTQRMQEGEISVQTPEQGFYTAQDLNRILRGEMQYGPSLDVTGHGTAVAGIATGYHPENMYEGIATEAGILAVKLGRNRLGFAETTDIMRGVNYLLHKAFLLQMPLVINLSYGSFIGPRDGSLLLERFLDEAAQIGKNLIVVGSGNEGSGNGHTRVTYRSGERKEVAFSVADYERDVVIQIWMSDQDRVRMELIAPGGERLLISEEIFRDGGYVRFAGHTVLGFVGSPLPYRTTKEVYVEIIGENRFVTGGIWNYVIYGENVRIGKAEVYMEGMAGRNAGTAFLMPNPELTITAPGTAARVITVGALDSATGGMADFSGRGERLSPDLSVVWEDDVVKPDLAAPGVRILAPDRERGYGAVTGTSFATPIISGSAALLMEWGIVRGNDPYLYGDKCKAMLRGATEPLAGMKQIPDERCGYGGFSLRNVRFVE